MNHLGDYDVIVIGAGHAGIEAAHAAAVLGAKTAVFTMSLDAIGNMPCNPSIGGTAKGTLVREVDALGGVMGLAADATYLQSRMLNKGKGPAVHALRVQTDRRRYNEYMKHALEQTPGLAIHQAEVVALEVENGHVKGVITQLHGEYTAKCVVLATGTNLGGKIFVGDAWYASGPVFQPERPEWRICCRTACLKCYPHRFCRAGLPARKLSALRWQGVSAVS